MAVHEGTKKWKTENQVCWFVEDKAIELNVEDKAENKVESVKSLVDLIFCFIFVILCFFKFTILSAIMSVNVATQVGDHGC